MSKIVNAFFWLSSLLPFWLHYAISDFLLYPIMYHVVGYRKRVVRTNLKNSFPEKDVDERRKIERDFYHFFCDYIVENCKLYTISPKSMKERMTFGGIEKLEAEIERHGIVFLYLGHYANWEYVGSIQLWLTPPHKSASIYRPLSNKAVDDLFLHLRGRFGALCIPKNEALRHIISHRQNGETGVIGFVSDQSPRLVNTHLWMDFLNQDTPVFTGTERIAKKMGGSVFFADITRKTRGHYHCELRMLTSTPKDYPDFQLTELYMHELEKMIRRDPAIWLRSHKRWKHRREA